MDTRRKDGNCFRRCQRAEIGSRDMQRATRSVKGNITNEGINFLKVVKRD
jgi:hypothetical protein